MTTPNPSPEYQRTVTLVFQELAATVREERLNGPDTALLIAGVLRNVFGESELPGSIYRTLARLRAMPDVLTPDQIAELLDKPDAGGE